MAPALTDLNNLPPKRPGYRWEYRTGCQCKSCPWKGNCRGEDWPHWIEVPEQMNDRECKACKETGLNAKAGPNDIPQCEECAGEGVLLDWIEVPERSA